TRYARDRAAPEHGRSEAAGCRLHEDWRSVAIFRGGAAREFHRAFCSGGTSAPAHVLFSTTAAGRQTLPERLCAAAGERCARPRGAVCGYGGRRHSREIGRSEGGRQLFLL